MANNFILYLLTLALVVAASASSGAAFHATWDDGDDDLPQRQEAMAEAVRVMSRYDAAKDAPDAIKRAVAAVNDAMAPLRPIFRAISKMPERTAAEVRAKEEAGNAANELLSRHLGQLLPRGSVKVENVDL